MALEALPLPSSDVYSVPHPIDRALRFSRCFGHFHDRLMGRFSSLSQVLPWSQLQNILPKNLNARSDGVSCIRVYLVA